MHEQQPVEDLNPLNTETKLSSDTLAQKIEELDDNLKFAKGERRAGQERKLVHLLNELNGRWDEEQPALNDRYADLIAQVRSETTVIIGTPDIPKVNAGEEEIEPTIV